MSDSHFLLEKLIAFPSITPDDAGCQTFMIDFLKNLSITTERFDNPPVSNFYAEIGQGSPFLLFSGHTDVVSPGIVSEWQSPPFLLTARENAYFGRGVADMKGALSAMLAVFQKLSTLKDTLKGTVGLLVTSGEEGSHYHLGTPYVMEILAKRKKIPNYCIVGEPSSRHTLGDLIKIGRRGSLNARFRLSGQQGHVAYSHFKDNPIHRLLPALTELSQYEWDEGNDYFPATKFQLTYLNAGDIFSENMVPGICEGAFNFRFSTETTEEALKHIVKTCFMKYQLNPEIEWRLSGLPFLTEKGKLLEVTQSVLKTTMGHFPILSTDGGTSDGRFIAPYGVEVIELGLVGKTIHQTNESIFKTDLAALTSIYYNIVEKLLEIVP